MLILSTLHVMSSSKYLLFIVHPCDSSVKVLINEVIANHVAMWMLLMMQSFEVLGLLNLARGTAAFETCR